MGKICLKNVYEVYIFKKDKEKNTEMIIIDSLLSCS